MHFNSMAWRGDSFVFVYASFNCVSLLFMLLIQDVTSTARV